MQQTVDVAVKETKDLDLETIPAYGLFYFYSAAADAATDLAATTTAVETAVSGLSFCYSAVAVIIISSRLFISSSIPSSCRRSVDLSVSL